MKRTFFRLLALAVLSLAANALPSGLNASFTVTTETAPFREGKPLVLLAEGGPPDVSIDRGAAAQTVDGFGGAFNEKGWAALLCLDPGERSEALAALFDPVNGAKFGICRVPIGASDYAMDRYTLNEVKDDFGMESFSIERDKEYLIPYIKAAMRFRPDLKVWASAWTPPTWMKSNGAFDGGWMRDDPKVYAAYALYLAKFLEAYQAEGIDAFAVAVQNEPYIQTLYPSCYWYPSQFLVFIRDYLGPLFKSRGVRGEIWLGTLQDSNFFAFPRTVLEDAAARAFVSALGYQWDGYYSVRLTRIRYPEKKIHQTETECGNWPWKGGYDPDRPQNDWDYGSYTWGKVKAYFAQGVNSYMLWNMVLDVEGKNLDSASPWPQNAAIVVDTEAKTFSLTPMYYAFKHFSYFVEPGAAFLKVEFGGAWSDAAAFNNPNGDIVLVMQNADSTERLVNVGLDGMTASARLPAKSWSTAVLRE